jgi:hypothetical protein
MTNGNPTQSTHPNPGKTVPAAQGGSTLSSTADVLVSKPVSKMTAHDAALQWLTAFNSGSVVSKVAVDDWQINRLKEIIPGFNVPGLLLVNISKPLFKQPADLKFKVYIIPDDALKATSALLPSLTSLPLLVYGKEQPKSMHLPEVTLQFTLPSIRLPTVAIPNLVEVAQRMSAHVPSLQNLFPSLAHVSTAHIEAHLDAMNFSGLTQGLSGAIHPSSAPPLLSSVLSILNGSLPGQGTDVNGLLEMLDTLRASEVGDGPDGLLDIENLMVALDGLRRAGHGSMQVSQAFFEFLQSLNREAVARHLPDLSNIINLAHSVHSAENTSVLNHHPSGMVDLLNSVKERTYGTIDLSGIASLIEGLQAADASLKKLDHAISQAEANLFLNGDPLYLVDMLKQVVSGKLDMSGLHALVQGLQQAGANVKHLIQTITLAEARLILAHDPTDAITLLQGVLGGTSLDLSGLNGLLQLLQQGGAHFGHAVLEKLNGGNKQASSVWHGAGAGAEQLTHNIEQVQGSMANVASIVDLLQLFKSSSSPALGSASATAQVAKSKVSNGLTKTITVVPGGAAVGSTETATGSSLVKVPTTDTQMTVPASQNSSAAAALSLTAPAAGAQSQMTSPQVSAMAASHKSTVSPTTAGGANAVTDIMPSATNAAPSMSVTSTTVPAASLAMQSSMSDPNFIDDSSSGAADLQSLAVLLSSLGEQGYQLTDLAGLWDIMEPANNQAQFRIAKPEQSTGNFNSSLSPLKLKEILSTSGEVVAGNAVADASDLALLSAILKARQRSSPRSLPISSSGEQSGLNLGANSPQMANVQAYPGAARERKQSPPQLTTDTKSVSRVSASGGQLLPSNETDGLISSDEVAAILSSASDSSNQDLDSASSLYSAGASNSTSYKQILQESKQEPAAWSIDTAFMDPKEFEKLDPEQKAAMLAMHNS